VFPKNRALDIEVTMPPDAWTRLIATAEQETWSTIDGQSLGEIGFRPKGEYSLDSCVDAQGQMVCDNFSFKLKFNELDPEGRFYGLKKLVLNQVSYGSAVFTEPLAYQVYRDFGIIAPRTSYAVLTVNGESLGIYVVVEVVDGRFTDRHFPGNGDGKFTLIPWDRNATFLLDHWLGNIRPWDALDVDAVP
jgi:spore coat protein CotH